MIETVKRALEYWGLDGAAFHLVAARENHVFRVDHQNSTYALRLHRPGYRTDEELWSELEWMEAVSKSGMRVPEPIAAISGRFLQIVDGLQIDLLSWLAGEPIGTSGGGLKVKDRIDSFHTIGREMAKFHAASDHWELPRGFVRPAWDRAGLVGEAPIWDRFWDNPSLSNHDREMFVEVRNLANSQLAKLEEDLDFGLIHADLVRENIIADGDQVQFIDFDDGGFGFRLFDLATTLRPNLKEPDYHDLKVSLLQGYQEIRKIDLNGLELFMLLRMTTYVGWVIKRMDEEGSAARNKRFVNEARKQAETYLSMSSNV